MHRVSVAATTWPRIAGRVVQIEEFVRHSSFYVAVRGTYVLGGKEYIFSESWIPREQWRRQEPNLMKGEALAVNVDPRHPGNAIWRADLQLSDSIEAFRGARTMAVYVGVLALAFGGLSIVFERKVVVRADD